MFRLLAKLGGARCQLVSDAARDPVLQPGGDSVNTPPDLSGIAAIDQDGQVQVFLCSHHDDWDVQQQTRAGVRVSGLETGRAYAVYRTSIDETSANAHTAWVRMGKPRPDGARALAHDAGVLAGDGAVSLEIVLPAHSICLLELVPVG